MSPADLQGRRAVVTGGTSGIGRACAVALADHGAAVVVVGHTDLASAEQTVHEIVDRGGRASHLLADVTSADSVRAAYAEVADRLGGLDIAVHAATRLVHAGDPLDDAAIEVWDDVIANAQRSVFLCCREAARRMAPDGGSIVNIASISGQRINMLPMTTGFIAYCAAKAAVLHLTRALAVAWQDQHIRVNSVSPGYVATPALAGALAQPELMASITRRTPVGRVGRPEEIAATVVHLAGDGASFVTGADVVVDGGYTVW